MVLFVATPQKKHEASHFSALLFCDLIMLLSEKMLIDLSACVVVYWGKNGK